MNIKLQSILHSNNTVIQICRAKTRILLHNKYKLGLYKLDLYKYTMI